jgi:DNA-binding beta-propeller fold protein YncE
MRYGQGDFQYELVEDWPHLPDGWGSFVDVGGVAVDREDNVYVLNRSEHPVIVFDKDGDYLRDWGAGLFLRAHGSLVAADGAIFCTDDGSHFAAKFTPEGELLLMLGKKGEPSDTGYFRTWEVWQSTSTIRHPGPPFNRPTGVAVNSDGDIFVSDGYGNCRVHRFDATGTLKLSWGEPGGAPGQFRLPHDVAIDQLGRVLVADRENSRIQLFTQDGAFLEQWHDVIRPTGLFIDRNGIVYVSEFCLRVSIFNPSGALLSRWGNSGPAKEEALFLAPHSIAADSSGDVYVGEVSKTYSGVDRGIRTIQKFRRIE